MRYTVAIKPTLDFTLMESQSEDRRAMTKRNQKKTPHSSPTPSADRTPAEAMNYKPTKVEIEALAKFMQRKAERPPAPRVKVQKTAASTRLLMEHADQTIGHVLLAEALGAADFDFVDSMLKQLADAVSRGGKVGEEDLNFLLSTIKDVKPRDQFEAMLAAQMAVVHMSIMTFARRMSNVELFRSRTARSTLSPN